jgi:hypothetical protein
VISNWWNDDPANRTTFIVDMQFAAATGQFDPVLDSVCLTGTMNKWSGSEAMLRVGNTLQYSITYVLDPGVTHRYKFRINADSAGLELVGKPDRIFRVPDTLLTLASDFNNINPGKRPLTLRCNMQYYITTNRFDPLTDYMDVAGNFNGGGSNDVLFDRFNDSVYSVETWLDTTWFQQGPLAFRFRINGKAGLSELQGKPDRVYSFHDTTGLNPNIYTCYFNNLDPTVPTPPWATGVAIQGTPVYKKILSGSYSYENVNGIAEGITAYRWLRSNNAEGLNAIAIDSATGINYIVDTVDIGSYLVFEVTPKAVSGDSALGIPVRAVTATRISGWDVGMAENILLDFTMYPNPASEYVHIRCEQPVALIEIISLTGQILIKQKISESELALPISLVTVPPGFYLVRLTGHGHSSGVGRLIVQ